MKEAGRASHEAFFRRLFKRSTGLTLAEYRPSGIVPTFTGIDVAIARTQPEYDGEEEVREIEAFLLDAIASAKTAIYWESQYFAGRRIVEAMAKRLRRGTGRKSSSSIPDRRMDFLKRRRWIRRERDF